LADMIDVKGMKAQGNQLTKLKVKEIVLTHSIDEGKEPWPEELQESELTISQDTTEEEAPTMEWDITSDEDDEGQPTLF